MSVRNISRRLMMGAAVGTLALSSLAACGGGSGGSAASASGPLVLKGEQIAPASLMDAARKEGSITAYFNYPEEQWGQVLDQFTQDTGITVNRVRAVTGDLFPRITAEAAAGKLGADVIDFGDPVLSRELADKKIIKPFQVPDASDIPKSLVDATHYTEVTELTPQIIAYNTAKVSADQAPTSFADLLQPQWKGQVGMTPIVVGGSAYCIAYTEREKVDPNYWSELAAQDPKLYESVATLTPDVAKGQIPVAITDLGVTTALQQQGAPLKVVYPAEGTPAFNGESMISATTSKNDAALVYEAWIVSKRGGDVISKYMTTYPSNPSSTLASALPASVRSQLVTVPDAAYRADHDSWTKQWESTFHYN